MLEQGRTHGRDAGRETIVNPSFSRIGIEGYADGMRMFPRLKEWENQIALRALREGKTVDDLRSITPFRQYLGVSRRAAQAGEDSPFRSFTSLFHASPSIDMLVSLGNFHTVRTWTRTFLQQHRNLNFPVEQFYQKALYTIIPYQAREYDPSFETSFSVFVVSMLKKRFSSFAVSHIRDLTSPVSYEEKLQPKRGRPPQSKERVSLASLEDPEPKSGGALSLREHLENTLSIEEDTTARDDLDARRKIHTLSQLAGLDKKQEETLVALYVYGGNTTLLSQMRRCTTRVVRMHRQIALEKLRALGIDTVQGVLTEVSE